ncbi:MAG: hypothetical protein O7E56_15235 [SAR324 cluster bacterium]|nr:hypothetical protein [SAR324 cluster bacterium]MCZ6629573.1 hypothetical protein [SAR324 cluster bacterium]MCZ6729768.1 hypothetical protein [SAR324 cluster bacterium]
MTEDSPQKGRIISGTLLAPLLTGLAYAAGRSLPAGGFMDDLYLPSPLTLAFFSGLLIAFACRPVLLRVPWSRGVAIAVAAAILLGGGPAAEWLLAWTIAAFGIGPFPYILPRSAWPELLGALTAAVTMGLLFRPGGGVIGPANLRARLTIRRPLDWMRRLTLLGVLAVALGLAIGWADTWFAAYGTPTFTPLVAPNLWLQVTGRGFEAGGFSRNAVETASLGVLLVKGAALLLLYWLRALALFLPLLPVALVLRGHWRQVALVFVLLLFIVGDFAPLILDQPYPSTRWLLSRTALGLLRALVLGGAAAWLIGRLKESGES